MSDPTSPDHYGRLPIQPAEYSHATSTIEEWRGACKFNINKYISRAPYKGSCVEDLRKARVYLDWLIESYEQTGQVYPWDKKERAIDFDTLMSH